LGLLNEAMYAERFEADLRSAPVNSIGFLDRPGHRGSVAEVGHLRPIQLLAALVHPDAVVEIRLVTEVGFAVGDSAGEQLKCSTLRRQIMVGVLASRSPSAPTSLCPPIRIP
jgi:hypothetical protein